MASPVNPFDFLNEDLATFLAKPVSDGDYSNVVQDEKADAVGEEAAATDIAAAAGALWGNTADDFILAAYPLLRIVAIGGGGPLPSRKDNLATQVITGVDAPLAATLSVAPAANSLKLFLNGNEQTEGLDYSLAGTTITWLAGSGTAVDMDTQDRLIAYYEG